jgi:hypothetical protein
MARRVSTRAGLLILTGATVGALVPQLPRGSASSARDRAEAASFRILAQARPGEELAQAVGDLGVVLRLRDGGWVAVRYRDCHAGSLWSSAVARDSGGTWFVSSVHYCGRFEIYRAWREQPERWPGDRELRDLEAGDLDSARGALESLGFRRVPPPAQ